LRVLGGHLILPDRRILDHVSNSAWFEAPECPTIARAQNRIFANGFKLIWVVQSFANISLSFFPKLVITGLVPARKRGVSRSSRTLGKGCGGREGVARRTTPTRTAKSCGPGAPWLAPSWRRCMRIIADDGDNKVWLTEESAK
jgi:hypothetical protein